MLINSKSVSVASVVSAVDNQPTYLTYDMDGFIVDLSCVDIPYYLGISDRKPRATVFNLDGESPLFEIGRVETDSLIEAYE